MAIIGTPRTFNKKFAFQLQIDGFGWAGFSKCSALKSKIAEVKHYEGGTLLPNKSLGRVEFDNLTLERGATSTDNDMYVWYTMCIAAPANIGVKEVAYKRNSDLVQLDRDGEILERWTIYNCFPVEYEAGEWDNNSDETVIEKMVLSYDYFVRTQ